MSTRTFRVAAGAAVLVAAALTTVPGPAAQAAAPAAVNVSVNTFGGLGTVPGTAVGINDAVWDRELGTDAVADLLQGAGVKMVRYPGGSYGDIYHFATNTAPGGFVAPNTDFDTFMAAVRRTGAQPMIIANYGTGSAQEAADWVRYANVTKGYGARYWEIGNELYGNGHYGADWEADNHADKSPAGYARQVVAYSDAMKAVDPSVKIGAVLTMPANWPDGLTGDGDAGTWNQTVLSIAASSIDFVILHWYPGGASPGSTADPAAVLAAPAQIGDAMYLVRQQIAKYAGARAAGIGIAVTETSSGVGTDTQPGALYAADAFATMLEAGAFTVDWWDVHNGLGPVRTIAGQTDYGDWGILSSAQCGDGGCEPALNTPFAPYYALQLLGRFARGGDQLIRAGTDQPLVSAHAARRPDGDLAVLLVNKDPDNARQVAIGYAGFTPAAGAPMVLSYTNGAASVQTSLEGSATSQTLPPYSVTVLIVHEGSTGAGAPAAGTTAPGQPTAAAVTDRAATVSWPAALPIRHAVARYEVYRQVGATSEFLGETPRTTFTADGLAPGTRYTLNVLAKDSTGALSWASPPLTVATGAPASSTCSVKFADVTDWGSGYVASIDITNNAPSPVSGWTLRFRWPTVWQSFGGGWNGTWGQTGDTVSVSNADFNGTLAPFGGTTNIGFVANYNGPNVLPVAFELNGTVCAAG